MAALPATPLSAPEPVPGLSEPQRIIDTFIAPSKTFTDLRRSARWWAPWLLMAIVCCSFAYAVDTRVGFRQAVENQVRAHQKPQQRMEDLPADQREQRMHGQAVGTRYFMYAFPLFILFIYAILAAIYLASFKFGANADLKYKTCFAVVVYASLPEIFRGLLAIVSSSRESFRMPSTCRIRSPQIRAISCNRPVRRFSTESHRPWMFLDCGLWC